MTLDQVREKYLNFFKEKGHQEIPSASLIPENDPSTLLTGSGMQPLLPYLLGKDHPKGARLVNSQKCFRAEDIDEVGDNRHTTFFEMLGNWSLGDYFKEEQLAWVFEFLTEVIGLEPEKLYVSCFIGDGKAGIEKDEESAKLWQALFEKKKIEAKVVKLGSSKEGSQRGMQGGRIFYYDSSRNWWSRSGPPEAMPAGEPGGPDSEIFYEFSQVEHDPKYGKHCHPNCDCGRFMEIGNSVFMQYLKQEDGSFTQLPKKNVDFGGGLERIAAASEDNPDIFQAKVLQGLVKKLETGKLNYQDNPDSFRVVADHLRAAVFLINDGVLPSNKDRGYLLRRLIRRASFHLRNKLDSSAKMGEIAEQLISGYPEFSFEQENIIAQLESEEQKFDKTRKKGLLEFQKIISQEEQLSPASAFRLFSSFGIPVDMLSELSEEKGLKFDLNAFNEELKRHQEISKSEKFKGGLADSSEKTTALHTATHLMLAGLRKYLGADVHQAGSNITEERSRFDFNYPRKVDREVLDKVEDYVNEAIAKRAKVIIEQIPKEKAQREGVEGSFWEKYPDTVDVYTIRADDGTVYSRELCGGPHVESTAQIKGHFKIVKEQSSSAGIRRIKAILE